MYRSTASMMALSVDMGSTPYSNTVCLPFCLSKAYICGLTSVRQLSKYTTIVQLSGMRLVAAFISLRSACAADDSEFSAIMYTITTRLSPSSGSTSSSVHAAQSASVASAVNAK